ncbi:MAG TPA: DUF2127 domain-containing protein [Verrucomicrobiae bacterium]|nr:DUF2127 domain-containing protein [Verrucomicrobiae bacterium]
MTLFHPQTLLDKTYEIGIIIKGVDGVLELIGGILVLALSPSAITGITQFLTERELEQDPHDFIATHILRAGQHLANGHNVFVAAFLLTHGLVKVVLVTCLLLNKLWAYPWALGVLGLFLVYQIYQLITRPTFGMAFLTVLDAIIIWLVYREWQKVQPDASSD